MSFDDRDRWSRRRRARIAVSLVPALLLGSLLLLAAGCGGGGKSPSVASLGPAATTTGDTPPVSSGGSSPSPSSQASGGGGGVVRLAGGSVSEMTKFASCMRSHGVPGFPDPNAQGAISIGSGSGIDPGSQQFQQAQQACQKLLPKGGTPSPAEQAQLRAQALAFSACMRSHGVPNFPDPQFGSGGRVTMKITAGSGGSGIDPGSPQFQAAQKACQKDLPGKAGAVQDGPPGGK